MIYTTSQNPIKNKPWYKTWKVIYALFGIILIVELILGAKTLLAPLPQLQKSLSDALKPSQGTKILLISPKITYKIGDDVPITIKVETGGYATVGTDVTLRYNPKILEASPSSFSKGEIYSDFPLISVDNKTGIIRISGISSNVSKAFNGAGEFGTLKFKAKAKGINSFKIDFRKGQTNDSNVMSITTNKDILEKVNDLNITIK